MGVTSDNEGWTSSRWALALGGLGAAGAVGYYLYRWRSPAASDPRPPAEFICPITHDLMNRPVFTSDGHSYERLAIVRWLQEHNTSPKTGAVLPDRDIRPNHSLRAQIVDFRAKHGMEELPPWNPDFKETIQSIMPADQGQQMQQEFQINAMPSMPGQQAFQVVMPGGPGQPMAGQLFAHPPGQAVPYGTPHQVTIPDAFSVTPNNQATMIRGLAKIMQTNPYFASNAELLLGLQGGAYERDPTSVARILAANIQVFSRLFNQVMASTELRRILSLGMYYDPDSHRFNIPMTTSTPILAIRNNDMRAVEQHVNSPQFQPRSPEAVAMLVEAIWCQDAERMTRLLLASGVPVNSNDSLGCSILAGASFEGNVDVVKHLLSAQADPNQQGPDGSTPLHQASFRGNMSVTEVLLDAGANALAIREDGMNPLLIACLNRNDDVALHLIGHIGPMCLQVADHFGIIPLSAAARGGSLSLVKEIVRLTPEETLNHTKTLTTQDGGNVAHHAASCGNCDVLEYLIDIGVDHEAFNSNGDTALHLAANRGDKRIVSVLLKKKVSLSTKNRDGFTALHTACWRKHLDVVKLLLNNGAEVTALSSNRSTPLHLAAWHGDVGMVEALLDAGASVLARTRDGDTVLHQSAFNNHVRCALFLLDKHGNERIASAVSSAGTEKFVDAQKGDGNTSLHLAAVGNHVDMIDVLLSKGCDPNIRNRNGQTALDLARRHQRSDAVLKLESHA